MKNIRDVDVLPVFKRLYSIVSSIRQDQPYAIIRVHVQGPRRIGKTTFAAQLASIALVGFDNKPQIHLARPAALFVGSQSPYTPLLDNFDVRRYDYDSRMMRGCSYDLAVLDDIECSNNFHELSASVETTVASRNGIFVSTSTKTQNVNKHYIKLLVQANRKASTADHIVTLDIGSKSSKLRVNSNNWLR